MSSVLLDVTSRGLIEAHQNVKGIRNLITIGTAKQMADWYNSRFKKTAIEIIESGQGMAENVGKYKQWKQREYGIDHPLGVLSGGIYFSVIMSQPVIKETRGKEVRLAVRFDKPYYIAYVIDGTSRHVGRDWVIVARDKELPALAESIGNMFEGLDFTRPYQELVSAILSYSGNTLWKVR